MAPAGAVVSVQDIGLIGIVGEVKVEVTIVIVVEKQGAHSDAKVLSIGSHCNIREGPITVIMVQVIGRGKVGYVQIDIPIPVHISPEDRPGAVPGVDPCAYANIGEGAIAIIAVQNIRFIPVAQVEIEVPVIIEIAPGTHIGRPHMRNARLRGCFHKLSVADSPVKQIGCIVYHRLHPHRNHQKRRQSYGQGARCRHQRTHQRKWAAQAVALPSKQAAKNINEP